MKKTKTAFLATTAILLLNACTKMEMPLSSDIEKQTTLNRQAQLGISDSTDSWDSSSSFVYGQTKPTASLTGRKDAPYTVRTEMAGSEPIILSQSDVTYENVLFQDYVLILGNNITFKNCLFQGPSVYLNLHTYGGGKQINGLVVCEGPIQGVKFYRCTFDPQTPKYAEGYWRNGLVIRGDAKVQVLRCGFRHTVDAINTTGATGTASAPSVIIQGNYIRDLAFYNNSVDHSNTEYNKYWTHNDGVQISKGQGYWIFGNNFQSYIASSNDAGYNGGPGEPMPGLNERAVGVTVSPDGAQPYEIVVQYNWFDAGEAGYQCNYRFSSVNSNNVSLSNNRFGSNFKCFSTNERDIFPIRMSPLYSYVNMVNNRFDISASERPTPGLKSWVTSDSRNLLFDTQHFTLYTGAYGIRKE